MQEASNDTRTLEEKFHLLQVFMFVGYFVVLLLCAALIGYMRYNRNVALKGDTHAARKIILPAFEPLLWIFGVVTGINIILVTLVLALEWNENSYFPPIVAECIFSGQHFLFLIVIIYMMQKSVSIPALRRTVCITLVLSMYTIPVEWLLTRSGLDDSSNVRFWLLRGARWLMILLYVWIFVSPPGRASARTLREFCVFILVYYALTFSYNQLLRDQKKETAYVIIYVTIIWATMCPLFIWRVLKADTEHWRGMGQRACFLQSLFRQKHSIHERISSQGLHVLIEMHRKYIIDFAHLELRTRIGVGSSATVFNGMLHTSIPVAIKVYTPTNFTEDTVAEFSHEAALCGALKHPNIVNFYGMCVFPPTICLVSELCLGSLDDVMCATAMRQHPANRRQELINIGYMIDAARAVAYLHSFSPAFLHRDIKPANFLVDVENKVKLTDFGESRSLPKTVSPDEPRMSMSSRKNSMIEGRTMYDGLFVSELELSYVGMRDSFSSAGIPKMTVKGTVDYMAPELISGKAGLASYGEAADVYALAVTMWDILNPGKEKFPNVNNNHLQIFACVIEGMRPRIDESSVHPSIRDVIQSAWHPSPRLRPSAQTIVSILEILQEQLLTSFASELLENFKRDSGVSGKNTLLLSGTQIVRHMEVMNYVSAPSEAVRLGNALMDSGLLHHCKHVRSFEYVGTKYFFAEEQLRPHSDRNGRVEAGFLSPKSSINDARTSSESSRWLSNGSDTVDGNRNGRSTLPVVDGNGIGCSCPKLGQGLENPKIIQRLFRRRSKAFVDAHALTTKLLAFDSVPLKDAPNFDAFDAMEKAEDGRRDRSSSSASSAHETRLPEAAKFS